MAVWSVIKLSDLLKPSRIDAEYNKPIYLIIRNKLKNYKPISEYISIIIHPSEFKRKYDKDGYSVIRAQNVRPLNIDINEDIYISEDRAKLIPKNILKHSDILITRTGANFGQTALYTAERNKAIVTSHTLIVRSINNDINPYIALFLNTHYGRELINQGMYGSSQPEIAPKFIKDIPLPYFSDEITIQLSNSILKSSELKKESINLYNQAKSLLEIELGLDKIKFEKPKSYTAKLSEVVLSNRTDSEFHNSYYDPIFNKIYSYSKGVQSLQKLAYHIYPNFNKTNIKDDIIYIEIGDISTSDGSFNFKSVPIKSAPANAKIILKGGEILISMVRPTRGAISLIPDSLPDEKYVVCSSAFYVINVKNLEFREIIWMYIRLIKMCFEKYCKGTSYPTIESKYLSLFPVPNFNDQIATEVSRLIKDSFEARIKSKQLLEQAKLKVEELIEQGVK